MGIIVAIVAGLWFADNAEFVKTAEAQRDEGNRWHDIDCRPVDETLPNIHIETPTGNKLVCWKLKK
jgi:hypothetical protein